MMTDDDNVKKLPVRFKKPPGEEDAPFLQVVNRWSDKDACDHVSYYDGNRFREVSYLIREGETEVECGRCHVRLDPMFVLRRMANHETEWSRRRAHISEEMKRLRERSRTKCMKCGYMTEISRR